MVDNQTTETMSLLKSWFDKAEKWQKDLFCQIWQGNEDVEKLTGRAFSLAKVEYLGEHSKFSPLTMFPSTVEFTNASKCPVILKSISEVQGVGALLPTKPLEFGNNLTIVYGENGCGKTSYVRVLKSAAFPKSADAILGNVYEIESPIPQAVLTYSDDGNEQQIHWKSGMKSACPLNIYDSSIAKQFAEEKNEVIYEPHILSLLSLMAMIYEGVKFKFEELDSENSGRQTYLDKDISDHESVKEIVTIKSIKAFDKYLLSKTWDENKQTQLTTLQEGLQDQDLSRQIKVLQAQKDVVEKQFQTLMELTAKTGNSFSDEYFLQRKTQIETKQEVGILVEELKKVSIISKTGSDNWKDMWAAAVKFSQELSLDSSDTIVIDGKCVLCQQEISEDAKERIEEFCKYMTSTAIIKSEKANSIFEATLEQLRTINLSINIEQIESVLRSSGIVDDTVNIIIEQYKNIKLRCHWFLEYTDDTKIAIPVQTNIKDLQDAKEKLLTDYMTRIESLRSIITDRDKQIVLVNNLLADRWIIQNKSILRKGIQLKKAITNCKTNALTSVKKELTQILITNTYITRFETEMLAMDCNHRIKVELVSKAEKGKAYHQVALRGAVQKKKTGDVLSEGEFRVVSLAAFLADLSSWNKILPFIFDDPITSLDHKYERKVADRLVKLSTERQVIVFTHRLAFAQLLVSSLNDYNESQCKNDNPIIIDFKQIELRNKPLGEPTEPTYRGTLKMKNALNNIKNHNIAILKKQYKSGEYENYNNGIKSLCSDLRKIVEQGIETDLLCGVVTRFGYSVNTLRLKYLYAVTQNDINLFDDLMTKYSVYEHSQSTERPLELPELCDIEKDVDDLIAWCDDFKKRCNVAEDKNKRTLH